MSKRGPRPHTKVITYTVHLLIKYKSFRLVWIQLRPTQLRHDRANKSFTLAAFSFTCVRYMVWRWTPVCWEHRFDIGWVCFEETVNDVNNWVTLVTVSEPCKKIWISSPSSSLSWPIILLLRPKNHDLELGPKVMKKWNCCSSTHSINNRIVVCILWSSVARDH